MVMQLLMVTRRVVQAAMVMTGACAATKQASTSWGGLRGSDLTGDAAQP